MITINQIRPGMTIMYEGKETTVLQGSYEDPSLGLMIKSSLYPGGMVADRYQLIEAIDFTEFQVQLRNCLIIKDGFDNEWMKDFYEDYKEDFGVKMTVKEWAEEFFQEITLDTHSYCLVTKLSNPTEIAESVPAVSFSLAIVDEVEPVKITAELIRQKVKPLTDLKIANMFDDKGYEAVKKAVTKTVKTRTAIEKQEKEILGRYRTEYDTKKKEVTDYTAELYKACREAQTALEAKLTVIDNAKKEAADKLAEEERQRTEGREAKMYEVGLTFNGHAFVGYGKTITKNSLHSFSQEAFDSLVTELEVLQMDSEVSGKAQEVAAPVIGGVGSRFAVRPTVDFESDEPKKLFDMEIYSVSIGGYTWVLTKGQVTTIDGQVIANQQVANSAIYSQVISTGFAN